MLAVARGQDQDPPSNSIILLALWRGPGSPPLSSSMLAQVQSKHLCWLLLFPHLHSERCSGFLSCHFPHSVPQLVLRSLTVVTSERQLSMVARMAAPAQGNPSPPHILYLCPVPWTHPVTVMAVTSLLLTKLTLPTATWRSRA